MWFFHCLEKWLFAFKTDDFSVDSVYNRPYIEITEGKTFYEK